MTMHLYEQLAAAVDGEVDLHGFHPHDDELYKIIDDALKNAHSKGWRRLRFIHGHGFHRDNFCSRFTNSNTGFLGQSVRSYLRGGSEFHTTKLDCSHAGSTVAFIRVRPVRQRLKRRVLVK